jgi:hypothetical protein
MTSDASERPRPTGRMPATDDFPTGAAIGEPVPEFTLPDQHGRPVALSEVLKESRALLVFHRSARW